MASMEGATAMGAMAEEGKAVLTPSQFNLWKQRKDAEAAAKAAEAARKREEDIAAGRVRMNGRELYKHEPWVFDDCQFS
ncbi:hypothetical protein Mp_2g11570 [Marchantia polymorpha subsp. ruderalis]|uniref:ZC3H15/TMA46 family C-terminal domain-containing protein n=1 Tax=Marchantia polymorpha TaxID=3197 RepID=A0A2R6XCS9_MARPO|nr:hypothetical protein MARPO_0023s0123 [Marchantia polymorpha]BBN01957.1 hypothetical protein Mp_2g11570 [Marchantia polymorpha subsp. ruderalis]|eukprot:PTQ43819.1 hypothetical protein MARPO_0023s0123 [Marchantia polymorpha]